MSKTSKYILISFIVIVIINFTKVVPSSNLFIFWLFSVVIADIYFSKNETKEDNAE